MAGSSVEKGNAFRDEVDSLLNAAGFRTVKETRKDFKKADISTLWVRDLVDGPQTFLIEAKDYGSTLDKGECIAFHSEYGELVNKGTADRAWLISRSAVSPDGRKLIESNKDLRCYTFEEFQRQLIGIDGYLRDLIAAYDNSHIEEYFVAPHTSENHDLETVVRKWLAEDESPPLAIMGGYGVGKSTFAAHMAATLAREALESPVNRAPILLPLGEIVDEQSMEGLIGKELAAQHRVVNYHFELISALNSSGRLVIIFDGFDEMKHGMTLSVFENNFSKLMRLDCKNAKILILGRDTAFHDDLEFKAIILGRQTTFAGKEVRSLNRRECRPVTLRGFNIDEARQFIGQYFPLKTQESWRRSGMPPSDDWIKSRTLELLSGSFDEIILKPVHAQMLCEIATQPDMDLKNISKFALYDMFIHYLLEREIEKRGRAEEFNVEIRRKFNGSLAWWLWELGGASTTSLADIPDTMCTDAAHGVTHNYDKTGLRRELTAGCLIEKNEGIIYFGHRSIQEFLVAEYLYLTNLLVSVESKPISLTKSLSAIDSEIVDFVVERMETAQNPRQTIDQWLSQLHGWHATEVPLKGFDLFVRLASQHHIQFSGQWENAWQLLLSYFIDIGATDFKINDNRPIEILIKIFKQTKNEGQDVQAAALYLWSRTILRNPERRRQLIGAFLSEWISINEIKDALTAVERGSNATKLVQQGESFLFWAFLTTVSITQNDAGVSDVTVDVDWLENIALDITSAGFADDRIEEDEGAAQTPASIPAQALYQAIAGIGATNRDMETLRRFINDGVLRRRIRPLKVERRTRRFRGGNKNVVDDR